MKVAAELAAMYVSTWIQYPLSLRIFLQPAQIGSRPVSVLTLAKASRSSRISRSVSASLSLRRVMSSITPIPQTTFPSTSRTTAVVSVPQTTRPSRVTNRFSRTTRSSRPSCRRRSSTASPTASSGWLMSFIVRLASSSRV